MKAPVREPVSSFHRVAAGLYLSLFEVHAAARVASWIRSDPELTWLAPGTRPPLTAQKVIAWSHDPAGRLLLWDRDAEGPIAYAELNRMPSRMSQLWIGHFVVDPARRGRSYGTHFAKALLTRAFTQCGATEVLLVVFPENTHAIQCYQKAGMFVLGRERKSFATTKREHLFLRMGINKSRHRRLMAMGQLPAEPLPFREQTRSPAGRG